MKVSKEEFNTDDKIINEVNKAYQNGFKEGFEYGLKKSGHFYNSNNNIPPLDPSKITCDTK